MGLYVQRLLLVFLPTALAAMRRLAILGALALLGAASANALDPARSMAQMHHAKFGLREGVPMDLKAIAQTPDGFLWLGSASGLFRFDGVRAEPFGTGRLPGGSINSLAASRNGDLWVGLDLARLARVRGGEISIFDVPAPGLRSSVLYLTPDPDGTIWVGTRDMILNFDGQRWQVIKNTWPSAATFSDPGGVWGMALARDGTVWAKNLLGLYFLRRGADAFEQAPGFAGGVMDFARFGDGRLWTADFSSGRFYALPDLSPGQPVPRPEFGAAAPPSILGSVMADRDGTLWNANRITGGLYRITSVTKRAEPERFTVLQGLASDFVYPPFEDREGNIWVPTAYGLSRFRLANVVVEPDLRLRPQAQQLVATQDALFLYTGMAAPVPDPSDAARKLYRIRPGQAPELVASDIGQIQAMAAAPDGSLVMWSDEKDLLRWRDGVFTQIAVLPEMERGHVVNLAVTPDGGLLVSIYGKGVYRLAAQRWSRVKPPFAPDGEAPAVSVDGAGAAWLFYSDSGIARIEGERITEFDSAGSRLGYVRASADDPDGFIMVGDNGIARFDGTGLEFLLSSDVPEIGLVYAATRSANGDLWIANRTSILRIERASLMKALKDPKAAQFEVFDAFDGVLGSGPGDVHNNSMVVAADGRLWVLMAASVAWIDPNNLHRNTQPPPVVITSATAGGERHDTPTRLALPAGASQLQIDYTALSFAMPERIRFRYRLMGVDRDWVEAGGRRQAFYTNVPPGEHRFQVIAANNDGVWNMTGATMTFSIAPTFLQSIWFQFLVVLIFAGLVWLAYSLRLRQQAARLQSRFDVRMAERERIARELHDTLLQSVQGLLLRFQSIANRVPSGDELRTSLDDALDRADSVLVEGRSRVRDLRTTSVEGDLAKAIVESAHQAIEGDTPSFLMTVEGTPRALHALVSEEVCRIAEEAIRNAAQHASAGTIEAVLSYGGAGVRLIIRDDGAGMPQSILTAGKKAGHYGLIGMRERAQRAGGRLEMSSRKGAGTEITLSIPARAAYLDRRGLFDWLWRIRPGSPA